MTLAVQPLKSAIALGVRRTKVNSVRASAVVNGNLQKRFHHPNPFDPQTTKGWKAAKKVNI